MVRSVSGRVVQALSGVAAVLLLIAMFAPLWSVSAFGYRSELRFYYIDILTNTNSITSLFSDRGRVADSQIAAGVMLIEISTLCVIIALVLSAISAVSKKGTGAAAVFAWATVVTAYVGTAMIISAGPIMRAITSTVVEINMGTAVMLVIFAGILLIAAWVLKR